MKKFLTLAALFIVAVIAVAIFTEKPGQKTSVPQKTIRVARPVETAPKIAAEPPKVVEEPKILIEPSKKIVEVPKKPSEVPKKTKEIPKKTVEKPKKTIAPKKAVTPKKKSTTPSPGIIESFKNMVGISKKPTEQPKKPIPVIKETPTVTPVAIKGRIAIVLDDWGYSLNNLRSVDEIEYPLTLAILPNLPYSRRVAEEAHLRGKEVILHMPMEPMEKLNLEKNTILVSMPQEQIISILDKDLIDIPYIKGINNHMGSKVTSDAKTMSVILKELKRRHLYFLDSFVTSKSVCAGLAADFGVKEYRRDVFLDNSGDKNYIRNQIELLKSKAEKNGFAIGIGHDRPNTLEVLKEEMPKAAKEGYKFVYL